MAEHDPILHKAISQNGTPIGYWRSGQGPALVLVHGITADASRWETVLPLLHPQATVYAMDRRGRGASGDGAGYSIADEAADVAAVVNAIADATGDPVDVLGHSYGAICALEAMLTTTQVRRLVLYEAPAARATPLGLNDRLTLLLEQGRPEQVVIAALRDLAGMSANQIGLAKSLPSWPHRVAAAHTVVREVHALATYRPDTGRFAELRVPTLLLAGADSPPDQAQATAALAAELPEAHIVTMAGQGHIAMLTAPELFATEVLRFLRSDRP